MTPELAERLAALADAGGTIVGPLSARSPSLKDFPAADRRVAAATARIRASGQWRDVSQFAAALAQAQCRASIEAPPATLAWMHRRLPDGDLFFLSNQGDEPLSFVADIHAPADEARLWDAVTGLVAAVPSVQDGERQRVPIHLPVDAAVVVTLRHRETAATGTAVLVDGRPAAPLLTSARAGVSAFRMVREVPVAGPWHVGTAEATGCGFEVTLDRLQALPTLPDPRARQIAGSVWYEASVDLPDWHAGGEALLSLGDLSVLAEVELNGTRCGTSWCKPWTVEIGRALRRGRNQLRILVTVGWRNRLVAAATSETTALCGPPPSLSVPLEPGTTAEDAGLLGPVTIRILDDGTGAQQAS